SADVTGSVGGRTVMVDADVVKAIAESTLHRSSSVRPERRTRTTAGKSALKSRGHGGHFRVAFSLDLFLLALVACAAARASSRRQVGATQDRVRSRIVRKRSR